MPRTALSVWGNPGMRRIRSNADQNKRLKTYFLKTCMRHISSNVDIHSELRIQNGKKPESLISVICQDKNILWILRFAGEGN